MPKAMNLDPQSSISFEEAAQDSRINKLKKGLPAALAAGVLVLTGCESNSEPKTAPEQGTTVTDKPSIDFGSGQGADLGTEGDDAPTIEDSESDYTNIHQQCRSEYNPQWAPSGGTFYPATNCNEDDATKIYKDQFGIDADEISFMKLIPGGTTVYSSGTQDTRPDFVNSELEIDGCEIEAAANWEQHQPRTLQMTYTDKRGKPAASIVSSEAQIKKEVLSDCS